MTQGPGEELNEEAEEGDDEPRRAPRGPKTSSNVTLELVAKVLGCTRERVRQIEETALKKAREAGTGLLGRDDEEDA
jgi:DNA-directed RNA polymerase sigma subunit (sigma70/sigma32)